MGSPHPHQLPVASAGGYAVSYSGSPYHQSSGNPMDAYPSSLLGDMSHWSLSEGPVATTRGGSMPDSYSPFTRTLYPPANSESVSSPYTTRYEHLLHDPRSPIPGLNTTLGGYVSPNYVADQVPVVPSHRYDARVVSAPRARHAGQFKVEEDEDSTIFAEFSDSTSSSSLLTSEFGTVSPHARLSPQPPWRHNPRVSPESSQSRLPVSEVTRVRSSTSTSGHPQAIFECQFCGKAFGKRSNLKTHEENKHRPGHVRRFECEYVGCDRKFDRKMDLKRHVKSVRPREDDYRITAHTYRSMIRFAISPVNIVVKRFRAWIPRSGTLSTVHHGISRHEGGAWVAEPLQRMMNAMQGAMFYL